MFDEELKVVFKLKEMCANSKTCVGCKFRGSVWREKMQTAVKICVINHPCLWKLDELEGREE